MIADRSYLKEGGGWKLEKIVEWRKISGKFLGLASSTENLKKSSGCNIQIFVSSDLSQGFS